RLPEVMPQLFAGMRVDGPSVIRRGEVENAIQHQRRGFDLQAAETGFPAGYGGHIRTQPANGCTEGWACRRPVNPRQRHLFDVELVDLPERAEPAARVIAVVSGPCIGGRLKQLSRVEYLIADWLLTHLCGQDHRYNDRQQDCDQGLHFSVTRYAVRLCI